MNALFRNDALHVQFLQDFEIILGIIAGHYRIFQKRFLHARIGLRLVVVEQDERLPLLDGIAQNRLDLDHRVQDGRRDDALATGDTLRAAIESPGAGGFVAWFGVFPARLRREKQSISTKDNESTQCRRPQKKFSHVQPPKNGDDRHSDYCNLELGTNSSQIQICARKSRSLSAYRRGTTAPKVQKFWRSGRRVATS